MLLSLCPWPNVTHFFTKQCFLPCAPLTPLSLPLTCWSPHHYHRSMYKGHVCRLTHKNFPNTSRFFLPCRLSSNVYVCTINPEKTKSEIYQTPPESPISLWKGKNISNVASWVFQLGGWIWSGHPVYTSGRGAFQIFLMTQDQFLTARRGKVSWSFCESPPPVSRAWYSPNSFQVKKARIFVQPHWLNRLCRGYLAKSSSSSSTSGSSGSSRGGSSSGNWDNSGE